MSDFSLSPVNRWTSVKLLLLPADLHHISLYMVVQLYVWFSDLKDNLKKWLTYSVVHKGNWMDGYAIESKNYKNHERKKMEAGYSQFWAQYNLEFVGKYVAILILKVLDELRKLWKSVFEWCCWSYQAEICDKFMLRLAENWITAHSRQWLVAQLDITGLKYLQCNKNSQ